MSMTDLTAQNRRVCILVPGIGTSYLKALPLVSKSPLFRANCDKACITTFVEQMDPGSEDHGPALTDTLDNQRLSYVINCTMCDLYAARGIAAEVVIGYSMGIYAALYEGGFYTFETGLSILEKAHTLASEWCLKSGKTYGMTLILGLTHPEIQDLLLTTAGNRLEIAMHNGKRNFVIAGERTALESCMEKALRLGALGTRPIQTAHPYHSSHLEPIAGDFIAFVKGLNMAPPKRTVLSLIDGRPIGQKQAAEVVVRSIHTPLHFDWAIQNAVRIHGVSTCHETGPPKSMARLTHYIDRKLIVHSFEKEER